MSHAQKSLEGLKINRDDRESGDGGSPAARLIGTILIAAFGVIVIGTALVWGLFLRDRPIVVTIVTIRSFSNDRSVSVLDASGYVTARRRATVSSRITGKVLEVLVEEGMAVEEGQVLARLDDAELQSWIALDEAQLAAAKKRLNETRVRLKEARLALKRTKRLESEGFASEANLDGAVAEVDSLVARLAAGGTDVEVAERRLAVRQRDLEDTIIRAPFAGIAISKVAQPGEMISPTTGGGEGQ